MIMNCLDASIRGIRISKRKNSKFQENRKYDASIGELNPQRLNRSTGWRTSR
jgi:hypothetical protein